MAKALCGICLVETGRELNPDQVDYCEKHSVNKGYWTFWRTYREDLDKIPNIDGLKEALIRALRVAAGLPEDGML